MLDEIIRADFAIRISAVDLDVFSYDVIKYPDSNTDITFVRHGDDIIICIGKKKCTKS